ncbi:MAG: hypothetical protein JNJ55_13915 [Betaproteobacteria bacterium]|nr:hypothetical protein [Betaproteobacteria bacterium]
MIRHLRLKTTALVCAAALAGSVQLSAQAGVVETVFDALGISGARSTYTFTENGHTFRTRVSGTVEFNEAEDDLTKLNGRLTILDKRAGITRMVDFKSDAASPGGIKRTYRLNNADAPIDAAGKQWIAEAIGRVARETGVNVEPRVKRIYAKGGAAAVLADIERIHSDHVRARHLTALLEQGTLDGANAAKFLDVSRPIDSDFEKRNVLVAFIGKQPLSSDVQSALLQQVAKMDSSYEQRQILAALAPKLASGDGVTAAWRNAIRGIDSDYEKRQIADSLAKGATINADAVDRIIAIAHEIDSDYERASALISVARHLVSPTPAQVQAYLACAQDLDSDYEKARALSTLLKQAKLDAAGYGALISAVRHIDSDYEAKNVLTQIARRMPAEANLVSAYRRAARNLGDYERMEAEKALDRLAL